jgi:hypothetical protein
VKLDTNTLKSPLKRLSVALIAILGASLLSTPAQAVEDIAISRTAFGAGVASNVGISLSGFDETQSYQATVKFVNNVTNVDVTNGTLAATASGTELVATYTSYSGTKLGFRGTYAQVAAALASVTWNPSNASGDISIRIGVAPYAGTGTFYDANSQRYYRYVSTGTSWTAARTAAENTYLYGLRGYLAEVNSEAENNFIGSETSATNIWIGATEDASTTTNYQGTTYNGTDGQRWIWAGAEQTPLPAGSGTLAQSFSPSFLSWAANEPNNDTRPGADCAVTNWNGVKGRWNDLTCTYSTGYLIEFGGRGETVSLSSKTFTQTVVAKEAVILGDLRSNVTCTFGGTCAFPLALTNPTAKNSSNVDVAGTYAYTSSNTESTTVSASGSGATVTLVGAGSSTITATFTPTDTTLYAGNTKSFTISVSATAPAAPTGLAATAGNGSVALSWTSGSNGGSSITDYLIEYSTDGFTWSTFNDGTGSSTSATVSGLTNGTAYSFRVSAINSVNTGSATSVVSATPTLPPAPISAPTPTQTDTPTPIPNPRPTPASTVEIGTAARPAPLVVRVIDDLIQALKPVIVDVLANPPANAPVLAAETALSLVTSTANKVLGNSPSLVLFDGQFQASRVVILDKTIAQVVSPSGGLLNLQAKDGDAPIAVSDSGRLQIAQGNLVEAQGDGLAPNTEFAVYMFSEPTLLGIGRTNDKGEFFVSFTLVNEMPIGNHTLQVNGLMVDGRTSSVSLPVIVVDKAVAAESELSAALNESEGQTPALPFDLLTFIGIFLLISGLWWFLAATRRRKKEESHITKPRVI